MSLSLSSLLNPSPKEDDGEEHPTAAGTAQDEEQRQQQDPSRESLPSIAYVQSPEMQHVQLPRYTPPQLQAPFGGGDNSTRAAPVSSQWSVHGQGVGPQGTHSTAEKRMSSGNGSGGPFELPPPPSTGAGRMGSPTLERYVGGSRSPEQRRASAASPLQPEFVLPPLQNTAEAGRCAMTQAAGSHVNSSGHHVASDEKSDQGAAHSHATLTAREAEATPSAVASSQAPHTTVSTSHPPVSSPVDVKQENIASPQPATADEISRPSIQYSEMDSPATKVIASLKQEHTSRTQSPLRDSTFPMVTTEVTASSERSAPKKRPASSKAKKGTATAAKKAQSLARKRKLDSATATPASQRPAKAHALKAGGSKTGTPAASSPTPSDARSFSAAADDQYDETDDDSMADSNEDVEGSGDVYCICRKPDNGTFMIGCDGRCDDWFHGKCVNIEERDKNLIDKYICPNCGKKGLGTTTWKRMCRRQGCRQPARVGKNAIKGTGGSSKYCSDECGVLFFREMSAGMRGREQAKKDRSSRRKAGDSDMSAVHGGLGARGGALNSGEVRALLDQSATAAEFKGLGDGVLSPPSTPDASKLEEDDGLTEAERELLGEIVQQKEEARQRHQLLKDRLKFVNMTKTAASRAAADKELKSKEYCGFDPRIEWSEGRFAAWRHSRRGQQAFELDGLDAPAGGPMAVDGEKSQEPRAVADDDDDDDDDEPETCERKKCARHVEWSKLAVDDVRFEMTGNSDRMRALGQEEQEIRDRAAMRAKASRIGEQGGSVEVHGLGITATPAEDVEAAGGPAGDPGQAMEVDTTV